jgi:hypothetical protein
MPGRPETEYAVMKKFLGETGMLPVISKMGKQFVSEEDYEF